MQYPEWMTDEDIAEFEREYNQILDEERQQYHDALERDHDEPYVPETNDNWYEEQYELDTDYL